VIQEALERSLAGRSLPRPQTLLDRRTKGFLSDPRHFSNLILQKPLRGYQLAPVRAILDSVLNARGLEFLLVFPRQSGKNEAIAQLLVYILNLFKRAGGNVIYGATGNGLGMGIERLEARLDNVWNEGQWSKRAKPPRRCLGKACVAFLSTHPMASARGQTAHHLLVVDEAQDQDGPHIEAVFTPMRAASNATAVYIGTVKLTTDFLWTKKLELERDSASDGIRRVFLVSPEEVTAEVAAYKTFLDTQIGKYGRHHPIVASEYFLEPIDGTGGLFPPRRRALMRGQHRRLQGPQSGEIYVATLDVAGEDEAATDPVARLANPGRDYTVGTVFRVRWPPPGSPQGVLRLYAAGPTYEAVDVFVDHGSKHFDATVAGGGAPGGAPAGASLVQRLAAWLEHWQVAHLVADRSGVGQGLVSWLTTALGSHRVTGFDFSGRGRKARLGSMFLSLVETGRFKYWSSEDACPDSPEGLPLTDAWWFWRQVEACTYEVPPEGQFDHDLRWQVPPSHRTPVPGGGPAPTHDDRLLSAALIAELDRLVRECQIAVGNAQSAMVRPRDPLADLHF
jgi:hypothetical protein